MENTIFKILSDMSEELNYQQLEKLQQVLLTRLSDETDVEEKVLDNNDYLELFVSAKRVEGCTERTIEYYRVTIEKMLDEINIPVRRITTEILREYLTAYQLKNNCSKVTIDNVRRNLSSFFSWLEDEDHIIKSPIRRIHKVKTGTVVRETLSDEQIELLRDGCHCSRDLAIIDLLYSTGMRVGETVGLRWEDIDFENNLININHTLVYYSKKETNNCVYAINTPKTSAGNRSIPMLPVVKDAFLKEKWFQKETEQNCNAVIDGYTDFVFINRFGGVQHQGTLNKALNRIVRDCNYEILDKSSKNEIILLPKFSCHILRHTFTTRMCEAGVNIKAMQEILGHSDSGTTLDIYTDATKDFKRNEIINLESYFVQQRLLRQSIV